MLQYNTTTETVFPPFFAPGQLEVHIRVYSQPHMGAQACGLSIETDGGRPAIPLRPSIFPSRSRKTYYNYNYYYKITGTLHTIYIGDLLYGPPNKAAVAPSTRSYCLKSRELEGPPSWQNGPHADRGRFPRCYVVIARPRCEICVSRTVVIYREIAGE